MGFIAVVRWQLAADLSIGLLHECKDALIFEESSGLSCQSRGGVSRRCCDAPTGCTCSCGWCDTLVLHARDEQLTERSAAFRCLFDGIQTRKCRRSEWTQACTVSQSR